MPRPPATPASKAPSRKSTARASAVLARSARAPCAALRPATGARAGGLATRRAWRRASPAIRYFSFSSCLASACTLLAFLLLMPCLPYHVVATQGSFANVTGLSACFLCDKGRASFKNGTDGPVVCDPCRPGRYSSATGQAVCTPCNPGESQPLHGKSTCKRAKALPSPRSGSVLLDPDCCPLPSR